MRFEIKVPVLNREFYKIKEYLLSIKSLKRQFENRYISSIYYDTRDLKLATYNIEGISERYKFRIRWYNNDKDNFRYEIKKKINRLGEKSVYLPSNSYKKSIKDLFTCKNLCLYNQLKNEEKFLIKTLRLIPIIKIDYLREYYIYKNKVRLTIDHTPLYEMKNYSHLPKKKDLYTVIEYKFDEMNYHQASRLIQNSFVNPKRYSKYVKGLSMMNKLIYF